MLFVDFLTDPETVAHVLPPPLEPADAPRLTRDDRALAVQLRRRLLRRRDLRRRPARRRRGRLRARDVHGRGPGDRSSGATSSASPRSRRAASSTARGSRFRAWVERGGVRLIDLQAELTEELGPSEGEGVNFNFKARPAVERRRARGGRDPHAGHVPHDGARRTRRHGRRSTLARHRARPARRDPRRARCSARRFVECDIAAESQCGDDRARPTGSCPTTTAATTTGARSTRSAPRSSPTS